MPSTVGNITQVSVTSVSDSLQITATTGTGSPWTYQWYRSTVSGFAAGTGNLLSGATALTLNDSSLTPGTIYYYKVVSTEVGGTAATATQLTVTTLAPSLSPNQFAETAFLGMTDLRFNSNTIEVMFDPAGSGTIVPGQALKWSTASGPAAPMVVPSLLAGDVIAGFANYNIKDASWSPGNRLQMSATGNVIYLYAAMAVNRGQQVTSLPAGVYGGCNGGVQPVLGNAQPVVGTAMDTAVIGALVRVQLSLIPYTTG